MNDRGNGDFGVITIASRPGRAARARGSYRERCTVHECARVEIAHSCTGQRSRYGSPAYGQYRPSGPGGRHEAWSLHVLDIRDERIARIEVFLDVERVFPLFGLPLRLDDEG